MTTNTETRTTADRRAADTGIDTVTGAFSYSGRSIAAELIARGRRVRTLTAHPERADDPAIETRALDFDDPRGLVTALEGTTTLFNTYWVRFAHATMTHERAVENTKTLFWAAKEASVRKIVHVSILHPSSSSPYPYFEGKARCERALAESGLHAAVLRPSVLFDEHGVLLNNIAWLLRRLPVFAIGARGDYRVRPIHVGDFATLAVDASGWADDRTVDAVGPERPTFNELVAMIRTAVKSRAAIVHVPSPVVLVGSKVLGLALHDVLLTRDEYASMAGGLADSEAPATGTTRLSAWLDQHGDVLGRTYASELDRHFRR